jgi:hypothetical protein
MEPLEYRSIVPLEVLAASLTMRLSVDELEWLWKELATRTEAEKRKDAEIEQRESLSYPLRTGTLGSP